MQSVPITTKCVSSNSVHGEVYSIQHYVILATGWWFSPVSPAKQFDHHDITEILLKSVLNNINLNHIQASTLHLNLKDNTSEEKAKHNKHSIREQIYKLLNPY